MTDEYFRNPEVHLYLSANHIETYNESYNNDIKSDRCLEADTYPELEFHAVNGCKLSSGKIWELSGDLSIKTGKSPLTMVVNFANINYRDKQPNARFGLFGNMNLDEFGIKYESAKELGSNIQFCAEVELIRGVSIS